MTSRRFPANLRLELKPSRLLASYLLLSHLAVWACVLASPLPTAVLLAVTVVLLGSAVYQLHSLLRRSGPYSTQALACREGQWYLLTDKGERAATLRRSWVLPLAVGMELQASHQVRLLILPDSCEQDGFRRLRQMLRFARTMPRVENGI